VQKDIYGKHPQNFSDFKITPFADFSPYGEMENIFESYDQRDKPRKSDKEVQRPFKFRD
jgi:hypothetical protein